ncbi:efflux RND transporter permease subunit [Candidatus Nitrospira neomarina]|uniref:Efflux RND transporter permease subunit n=1 Tax=Candidatus Nitrospira neomarina TaxID=3020899 RepID=A0AA96GJH2_9BACT|nr:efflux RND transporter permease subunit [Candidatus Nitrospira neomarina]WNM62543.1 efflux RND transporter permease subunit [Candidatus Nitrospira neomarina]
MKLLLFALRRPLTIMVLVASMALFSYLVVKRMAIDIFPNLGLPAIYVAQPYGGMDPAQMEAHLVSFYEYHFLYITGIEHVESKSIQGAALMKLFFHPDTDMDQALAQTVAYVNRSRAFMPPGTVPPFISRFDAGSVPVGYLVFKSQSRSLKEIQDLALFRVRPMFSAVPGVSAPPPFGGTARTIVIKVNPERLRAFGMSPEEVVQAVRTGNMLMPAGNVRIGELAYLTPVNSVVENITELEHLPIRLGAGPTVFLKDVGTVEDGEDIVTSYAMVNGRRTVYIPVTKRADASTMAVVDRIKASLPTFRDSVPDDIQISFEFDQSTYVTNAVKAVVVESVLGAVLTGLVVWLFLRSWRSSVIVVMTIPFALLSAVVALWATGQTINIMTLGGLALAVGILVDESTVTIENVHAHLSRGKSLGRAVKDSRGEVVMPLLLSMLSILAVFLPSFFMSGVAKALFVPLALAVGFAMAASYILSTTLVPVLAVWLLGGHPKAEGRGGPTMPAWYINALNWTLSHKGLVLIGYMLLSMAIVVGFGSRLGLDIFPRVDTGQFQLRILAPDGTRVERTELLTKEILETIKQEIGPERINISLGFVGVHPSSYPVNTLYMWSSGPHEAVLLVALKRGSDVSLEQVKERLREILPKRFPGTRYTFESGDIVTQVMSMGSPTPIEIAMSGPNMEANRAYAERVREELSHLSAIRDLRFGQPLDYPTLAVRVDRVRAGQLGVTAGEVARAVVSATSSTRFVEPIYWHDPQSGRAYQVQVEIPQSEFQSVQDMLNLPVMLEGGRGPLLRDVAEVIPGTSIGEYARYNMQRMVTIVANVTGEDLGRAAEHIEVALNRVGPPPKGVRVDVRGQIAPMKEMFVNLQLGLALALLTIFLLLAASFQSWRSALVVLLTTPAVLMGVVLGLELFGTTLNIQSFLGAIMATGVAVANAILLVSFAEHHRRQGLSSLEAAREGAGSRARPILMTGLAMMAGMLPMALGVMEGGEQVAPLGQAVIGGLLFATVSSLLILPAVYAILEKRGGIQSPSLDPDDPTSIHYEPSHVTVPS